MYNKQFNVWLFMLSVLAWTLGASPVRRDKRLNEREGKRKAEEGTEQGA